MKDMREIIHDIQNKTKPPRHMALTREDTELNDGNVDLPTVIEILKAHGYNPIESMVKGRNNMTPGLQFAVDRYIGNKVYPDQSAVKHTGDKKAPVSFIIES